TYDPMGRILRQSDALTHTATYFYDTPTGNIYTDPHGNPWTYQHNASGQLVILQDPNSGQSLFDYDGFGRLQRSRRPLGDAITYTYDMPSGYVSSINLADMATFLFDHLPHTTSGAQLFDLTNVRCPDGTNVMFGRDASGNVTNYQDQAGLPWTGTYNTRGQILTWTNPGGGTTTFTYDAQGRPATRKDNAGNTIQYIYDPLSR